MTIETVHVGASPPPDKSHWWWWVMSGDDYHAPAINNGEPYLPNITNSTLRDIFWWIRNPLGNFFGHVVGVQGKDRWVRGPAPVLAATYADTNPPQTGWKWAITNGWLPYISYYGWCEFYLGWRPHDGALGLKIVNASRGEN